MCQPTRLHWVRHGLVHNPEKVHYGRLEGFALSEEGRRQARAAAELLSGEPIGAVYSSPLLRARETAEIILAEHSGLRLHISDLLHEVHCPYDGQPRSELAALGWDVYTGTEPPYEQTADVVARARRFLSHVRRQFAGQRVVAVTHGDLIALIALSVQGRPTQPAHIQVGQYPEPASITTFVYPSTAPGDTPSVGYVLPY
jgi:broad specificity phosphatase PhoE